MQEQVNEKAVALYIKTGKLTAEMLQRAIKKLLSQMKKQADRPPHGKQIPNDPDALRFLLQEEKHSRE